MNFTKCNLNNNMIMRLLHYLKLLHININFYRIAIWEIQEIIIIICKIKF